MAEYLSDEELVERIKRWWSQNGMALVVGVVLAIGGVVGWRWFDGWRLERAEAGSDAYAQYLDARATGEDVSAEAGRIAEAFPDSAYHVFTLLHEAKDAVEAEEWERAAELLRESVDLGPEDALQDVARVRLARVLYQLERPDEALVTLAEVNGRGFASGVAELTGDIELRRGAFDAAREAYRAALGAAPSEQGNVLVRLKLASIPPEAAGEVPSGAGEADSDAGAEVDAEAGADAELAAEAEAAPSGDAASEGAPEPSPEAAETSTEAADAPETGEADE